MQGAGRCALCVCVRVEKLFLLFSREVGWKSKCACALMMLPAARVLKTLDMSCFPDFPPTSPCRVPSNCYGKRPARPPPAAAPRHAKMAHDYPGRSAQATKRQRIQLTQRLRQPNASKFRRTVPAQATKREQIQTNCAGSGNLLWTPEAFSRRWD